MSLERGRDLVQGILLLVFAAIAIWVSQPWGVGLVIFMGVMKLQESATDWCPSDIILRALGLKKKAQTTS